jgi:hypothetical protein
MLYCVAGTNDTATVLPWQSQAGQPALELMREGGYTGTSVAGGGGYGILSLDGVSQWVGFSLLLRWALSGRRVGGGVVLSLCWLLPAAALGFAEHCSQTLPQNTARCFTHIFYPSPAAHQDCQLLTGWHISRVACCCHGPHRPRRSSSLADRRPQGCCRGGYGVESCLRGL